MPHNAAEYSRAYREELKAAGLCAGCKTPSPRTVYCATCMARMNAGPQRRAAKAAWHRQKRQRLLEAGKCVQCGGRWGARAAGRMRCRQCINENYRRSKGLPGLREGRRLAKGGDANEREEG